MAKMVKGTKRYVLLRGKDENEESIVIDIFGKRELDRAVSEGRVTIQDQIVKIEVLGRFDLRKSKSIAKS